MQMFKMGQQGERMSFTELCKEFESAHVPALAASTQTNVRDFLEDMRKFFGDRSLTDIDAESVTDYRNHARCNPQGKNQSAKSREPPSIARMLICAAC